MLSRTKKGGQGSGKQSFSHTETIEVHAKFESHTTEESLMGVPSPLSSLSEAPPSSSLISNFSSSETSEIQIHRTRHWNKENHRTRRDKVTIKHTKNIIERAKAN